MHSFSYLSTASRIIESYDGNLPLAAWLKQFFKSDKKFGSRDRKNISHICYCFYRLGGSFKNLSGQDRMLTALFLCSDTANNILEELRPEWNAKISLPVSEKIEILSAQEEIKSTFPLQDELSKQIEQAAFNLSFLIQPDLFLRIRAGKKERVIQQLQSANVQFSFLTDQCIQLPNQSKLDEVVSIDKDVVIQDYNSQRTIEILETHKLQATSHKLSVWDCCAASGGKSILFHDRYPNSYLTVSDVRESILINLQKRFNRAGIKNYEHFIADVSSPKFSVNKKFDVVICDAPCSGSGTWGRTPEQLYFFRKERINYYAELQRKIAVNAAGAVKKGGYLLYITCSVFQKENEQVVKFIEQNSSLDLKEMNYLKGYDKKADTLFVAIFYCNNLMNSVVTKGLLAS